MSHKKPNISDEESRLFREAVSGKLPPQPSVADHKRRDSHAQALVSQIGVAQESEVILARILPQQWVLASERIQYFQPGITQRTRQQLKRGQIAIESELDLHRLSGNQALALTREFLQTALRDNKRCVLIIHGKGSRQHYPGPILKNLIAQWLPEQNPVLGYCSAQARHGGEGAIYVLLRRY